jgi:hypothetical protein
MSGVTKWSASLAEFSQILDDSVVVDGPNHHLRIRCGKVTEEAGEVEQVLIALEGSNPRKPPSSDQGLLVKELLDVATAALGAIEHLTGNRGVSARLLEGHCDYILDRMKIATA